MMAAPSNSIAIHSFAKINPSYTIPKFGVGSRIHHHPTKKISNGNKNSSRGFLVVSATEGSAKSSKRKIGSIFEYVNQNPVFGLLSSDSIFYAPVLGFFAGIPTSFELKWRQKGRPVVSKTILRAHQKSRQYPTDRVSQNVDLPPVLPEKKKKPYPVPITKILQDARKQKKLAEKGIELPLKPPQNGLLVDDLIPVAHEVLDAWKILIKGLAQLLHVIPVYGCSECSEVHVAQSGHRIQDCQGLTSRRRKRLHSWVKGSIDDVLVPIESYHLHDPFGKRVTHETRFEYDRIPAVIELCIQAGVDIPEYPSRRRTNPIRKVGKKVIDRDGYVKDSKPWRSVDFSSSSLVDLETCGASGRHPPPSLEDVPRIAQETMNAYEVVRSGVTKLMRKYTVKACGYCSEIHVGPWGHDAKLCGEYKHQWRDGKHGWQDAVVDEVFPPNYVWHVRDPKGPPMRTSLKRFYGKAPAVVEVCMQGGAEIPERYKPMMRLDIIVPDRDEARLVA